jgi:hypothetical protein
MNHQKVLQLMALLKEAQDDMVRLGASRSMSDRMREARLGLNWLLEKQDMK